MAMGMPETLAISTLNSGSFAWARVMFQFYVNYTARSHNGLDRFTVRNFLKSRHDQAQALPRGPLHSPGPTVRSIVSGKSQDVPEGKEGTAGPREGVLAQPSRSFLLPLHADPLATQGITPSPTLWGQTLTAPLCPELELDDDCAEAQDGELDGLWTTITVFISLFLLSVCYSATVTLYKVKWIFSSVVELKQTLAPDYRNMIGQGA
ncbi:uncharacterized protein LOC143268525 [Peromyscus maniculatus bairdii]|uniref:uncharacterized protein LOC143268525 n=1 Tax=Peromyscus maniculatus bairdii TaxID=230844 RepID=UPI003FD3FD3B